MFLRCQFSVVTTSSHEKGVVARLESGLWWFELFNKWYKVEVQ